MIPPHGLQLETTPRRRILNNQIARRHDSEFRTFPFTESGPASCHVDERYDRSRPQRPNSGSRLVADELTCQSHSHNGASGQVSVITKAGPQTLQILRFAFAAVGDIRVHFRTLTACLAASSQSLQTRIPAGDCCSDCSVGSCVRAFPRMAFTAVDQQRDSVIL